MKIFGSSTEKHLSRRSLARAGQYASSIQRLPVGHRRHDNFQIASTSSRSAATSSAAAAAAARPPPPHKFHIARTPVAPGNTWSPLAGQARHPKRLIFSADGTPVAYDHVFLRDACRCAHCVDPATQQRLFQTADIPPDIEPAEVLLSRGNALRVRWRNDVPGAPAPHWSEYSAAFLQAYASAERIDRSLRSPPREILWDGAKMRAKSRRFEHAAFMAQDVVLYEALHQLCLYGIAFVRGVPDDTAAVEQLAARIGPLMDTIYGRSWDVQSKADAKNIAYTQRELGLHMDLLYMTAPPGLQLLHCLRNSAAGGSSVFADAFRAATHVRLSSQMMYTSLCQFPVSFHYHNDGHHFHYTRPTIEHQHQTPAGLAWETAAAHAFTSAATAVSRGINGSSSNSSSSSSSISGGGGGGGGGGVGGGGGHGAPRIAGVNWAPPFQAPFRVFSGLGEPARNLRLFLGAARAFADALNAPSAVFERRLLPGECVIFCNRRVAHGRRAFDARSGERWLRGAYVDGDSFRSRYRVLAERFAPEREIVPGGNEHIF